jgi:hypothetical protein
MTPVYTMLKAEEANMSEHTEKNVVHRINYGHSDRVKVVQARKFKPSAPIFLKQMFTFLLIFFISPFTCMALMFFTSARLKS